MHRRDYEEPLSLDPNNLLLCASKAADARIRSDASAQVAAMEAMVQRNVTVLKELDSQLEEGDVQRLENTDCMLMLARLGHMHLELAYVCVISALPALCSGVFALVKRAWLDCIYFELTYTCLVSP